MIIPNLLVRIIPSKARRALPESARDIHEEYDGCYHQDFCRRLKAKLPEKDYPQFIKNYGGLTKYDPLIHGDDILGMLKIGMGNYAPEWWDEDNENINDCYFIYKSEDDYILRVEYHNGWLYLYESRT